MVLTVTVDKHPMEEVEGSAGMEYLKKFLEKRKRNEQWRQKKQMTVKHKGKEKKRAQSDRDRKSGN